MEDNKIGFFRRVKKAIFNFDEYSIFSNEKVRKSFGYLFKIIIIMAIIITIATTYKTFIIAKQSVEVFKNEAPDFTIINGKLTTENDQTFQYIDDNNYFGIIIDAKRQDIQDIEYNEGIVFTKDKVFVKTNNKVQSASYNNFISENFSKKDVEALLTKENLIKVYLLLGLIIFISNFIAYTIVLLINILTLSVLGLLINWIAKTNLKYSSIFNMSVYAMTLPIILLTIYTIVNLLFGFTVKYFNIAFDIISYIYIVTVILMMKSDLIKNKQELFVEENKKGKEKQQVDVDVKTEKKKKKKKEKKENQGKETNSGEPEGSKA